MRAKASRRLVAGDDIEELLLRGSFLDVCANKSVSHEP
jgi:hypothetical protein